MTGRNCALTSICGKLWAKGRSEEEILAELLNCPERDGLPENEVRSIVRSIARNYPQGRAVDKDYLDRLASLPPLTELEERRGWRAGTLEALACKPGENGERVVYFPMWRATRDGITEGTGWRIRRSDNGFFKRTDGSEVKALTKTGSHNGIIAPEQFNMQAQTVLVVEGEADCAAAISAGWLDVAATPGATPGKQVLRDLQALLAGRRVVLCPDPDEAGEAWRDNLARMLRAAQCDVLFIPAEPGADLDKRLAREPREKRAECLQNWISGALPWVEPKKEKKPARKAGNAVPEASVNPAPGDVAGANTECQEDSVLIWDISKPGVANRAIERVAQTLAKTLRIFSRAGDVVEIIRAPNPEEVKTRLMLGHETPIIHAISESNLTAIIWDHFAFATETVKENGEVVRKYINPPEIIARSLHSRGHHRGLLPYLEAVSEVPVLLPSGRMIERNGYDEASGFFIAMPKDFEDQWRPFECTPGPEETLAAIDSINDLISDFPFEFPAHKSAWIAALLTACARYSFHGPAPLFLIEAPVRGSGKSKLADAISIIATGHDAPKTPYKQKTDEVAKDIMSFALGGIPIVCFDDVKIFGDPNLDSAITTTLWSDRILGRSETRRVPLKPLWLATGNDVTIHADTSRRICCCRLKPLCEKPDERTGFKYPQLLEHIRLNRAKYFRDAITLILYGLSQPDPFAAGQTEFPEWGSFEGWSRVIRRAIIACGEYDPHETKKMIENTATTDREELGVFLAHLFRIVGEKPHTTKGILDLAAENGLLRDALKAFCTGENDGLPSQKRLGYRLRGVRGRYVGGLSIDTCGVDRAGTTLWAISPLGKKPPELAQAEQALFEKEAGE